MKDLQGIFFFFFAVVTFVPMSFEEQHMMQVLRMQKFLAHVLTFFLFNPRELAPLRASLLLGRLESQAPDQCSGSC